MASERDIYEVANQLQGWVDPSTPKDLAAFLLRESDEAAKLADTIERQSAALRAYCDAFDNGTGTVYVNPIIRDALRSQDKGEG